MAEQKEPMNLLLKVLEIRSAIDGVEKSEDSGDVEGKKDWKWATLGNVLDVVKPLEKKYKVLSKFDVYEDVKTSKDGLNFVKEKYGELTLENAEDPNEKPLVFKGIDFSGMSDDIAWAGGSGETYGMRKGYMRAYQIPDRDPNSDPESKANVKRKKDNQDYLKQMGMENSQPVETLPISVENEFNRVMTLAARTDEVGTKARTQIKDILGVKKPDNDLIKNAIAKDITTFSKVSE